jgi:hypothetical protein
LPSVASAVRFEDVAQKAGLDYVWKIEGKRPLSVLPLVGNGAAFLDFDADGNLDILLVGTKTALYKGDGKGGFQNVSATALPALSGQLQGCAVGDYDGDGFPDLYLSGFQAGVLLRNEAGKRFRDATPGSGVTPQPWGTACAWVETVPGSGRLDLIVGNYARFGPGTDAPALCPVRDRDGRPLTTACPPRHYLPLKPAFFQNLGGGKFQDATKTAGLRGR